jgi:hypothetical protein
MTNDDRPSGISDEDESDSSMPSMGTLVIRTWHESNQEPSFRARVTYSQVPGDEPGTAYSANPNEVLSVVRQWLFAQSAPPSEV